MSKYLRKKDTENIDRLPINSQRVDRDGDHVRSHDLPLDTSLEEPSWRPVQPSESDMLPSVNNSTQYSSHEDINLFSDHVFASSIQNYAWRYRIIFSLQSILDRARHLLQISQDARLAFWVSLFGAGIVIYFQLPNEPVASMVGLSAVLLFYFYQHASKKGMSLGFAKFLLAACVVFTGVFVAQLRVLAVGSPMLETPETGKIIGTILNVEHTQKGGRRYDIKLHSFSQLAAHQAPYKVRVTSRDDPANLKPGDIVSGSVRLIPHSGPAYPGGYDFGFAHYFQSRGALGFTFGHLDKIVPDANLSVTLWERFKIQQARMRLALAKRIRNLIPQRAGHVVVALITGERITIADDVQDSLRASGLAHILAISGLHMGLVTATVFFVTRFCFTLVPSFALYYPSKKYAAIAALFFATLYLIISGTSLATQRAFLMLAVMLVALLLDRRAISLRNVALAAGIVLILQPEAIFTAGFQMSFAAVSALVVSYQSFDKLRERAAHLANVQYRLSKWQYMILRFFGPKEYGKTPNSILKSILYRWFGFFLGIALTSLIAGTATAIFAAYHFHRIAPMGFVANILAMPIVTLFLMPAGLIAMIVAPFGLDLYPLKFMAWCIELVIAIANWSESRGPEGFVGIQGHIRFAALLTGLFIFVMMKGRSKILALFPVISIVIVFTA